MDTPTTHLTSPTLDDRLRHMRDIHAGNVAMNGEELEEARKLVLYKIQRTFGLSDADVDWKHHLLTPKKNDKVDKLALLQQERSGTTAASWIKRRDAQIYVSNIAKTDDTIAALDKVRADAVDRYMHGFFVRQLLMDTSSVRDEPLHVHRAEFIKDEAIHHLTDIYVNHTANQAEADLRDLGMNPISAHKLNGLLIKEAVSTYNAIGPKHASDWSYVGPQQKTSDKSRETLFTEIEELQQHWHHHADILNDPTRKARFLQSEREADTNVKLRR